MGPRRRRRDAPDAPLRCRAARSKASPSSRRTTPTAGSPGADGPAIGPGSSRSRRSSNSCRGLDGEAIRIEAGRAGADSPTGALRLAKKARDLGVPEPEPSALAHRGFRLKLAEARTAAEFEAIAAEIEALPPRLEGAGERPDLAAWEDSYRADPAATYRIVPVPLRHPLDRRLWADAEAASLDRQVVEKPDSGLAVAEAARSRLPDRPALADRIEKAALDRATDDEHLSTLRRDDVEALSRKLIDRGQPEAAQALKRRWLEDQRRRKLRPGDAEGRVLLAAQFEAILGDRASAIGLLKEAWAIDPQSKTTADAFRRLRLPEGRRRLATEHAPRPPRPRRSGPIRRPRTRIRPARSSPATRPGT